MGVRALGSVLVSAVLWASPSLAQDGTVTTEERIFTTDEDFALGIFEGSQTGSPEADQVRIATGASVPPFLWITHATQGLVTRIDTRTGVQAARYDSVLTRNWDGTAPNVKPPRDICNYPGPAAVDASGDAFVVNRGNCGGTYASLTKYAGSLERCVDRNGNGQIDTSEDANQDGVIDPSDPAEFRGQQDECILWTKNYAGMSDPGRSLVVDAHQNVWAAGYLSSKIYQLDGQSGQVLKVIDLRAETGIASNIQGLAIGPGGYLYTSDLSSQRRIWKVNPDTLAGSHVVDSLTSPVPTFGIAVDPRGVVWLGGDSDAASGVVKADFEARTARIVGGGGGCLGRTHGITVDASGDIWASCWSTNRLLRVSPSGTFKQTWVVGSRPEGVAVASDGKLWTVNTNTSSLNAIDPAVPSLSQSFSVGGGPLTYADMTGFQHHAFILRQGSWRVIHDSGRARTHWGTVTWNQEPEGSIPAGSSITVAVRAAPSLEGLSAQVFVPVLNGQPFAGIDGRFLELKVSLRTVNFSGAPVLSDLTIFSYDNRPVAACRDRSVCAGPACIADVQVDNGSYDPDEDPLTWSQAPGGPYSIGTREVSLTVDDGSLSSTCSASVRVRDCEPPSLTCAPVTAECTGNESATLEPHGAEATDACSSVSVSGPGLAAYPLGSTFVTYTATDAEGNTAVCTSNVEVVDSQAPALVLQGSNPLPLECNVTSYADPGASAVDVCSGDLSASITTVGGVDTSVPGTYPIRYRVQDRQGNVAEQTRVVQVEDTLAPTLTVPDAPLLMAECSREALLGQGVTAMDVCAGDISDRIILSGLERIVAPGTYPITYSVADPSGSSAAPITRSFTLRDTQAPVVVLNGAANMELECGVDTYSEPGATAYDACQGDMTDRLQRYGNGANAQAEGTYSIQYGIWDSSGNTTMALRTVRVSDRTPPVLSLVGPSLLQHECASGTYIDPGATAVDACYGNLTHSITTTGSVNAWAPGSYPLSYNVQDTAHLSATPLTRTVQVVDTQAPVASLRQLSLWPPDGSQRDFTLADCMNLSDACDGWMSGNQGRVVSIYSDEPEDAPGSNDGDTQGDILVTGSSSFRLRLERQSDGDGRVYGVSFEVQDRAGNVRSGLCRFMVPPSAGGTAVDGGPEAGYTVGNPALSASAP
jgi:hypothetical protein